MWQLNYSGSLDKDTTLPIPWVGPSGVNLQDKSVEKLYKMLKNDNLDENDLVLQSGNLGELLCLQVVGGDDPPSLSKESRPIGIKRIGKAMQITNFNKDKATTLWFITNDIISSELDSSKYWNDNVGNFWVVVNRN